MKTGRTHSTTKDREGAILKKVGSVETWFGKETDHDRCWGEGAAVMEKNKTQTSTQGSTWGKQIPIAKGLESERASIFEYLYPVGLN